ncbi:MAG: PBP1A family penicillin-binding protein, partial [Myxococcota bacterium]
GRDLGTRLAERALAVPSRVYSRPLVLVPGARIAPHVAASHLRATGHRARSKPPVEAGQYWLGRRTWEIGSHDFRYPDGFEPGDVVRVELDTSGAITRLTGADGEPRDALFLAPELLGVVLGPAGEDRRLLPLERIPGFVIDAVLAAEDRRFYEHHGIDWRRVAGALWSNVRARRVVEGGSTLTQQLVKNLYVGDRRSLLRKLREAPLAMLLELRHTKDEILEAYLNEIYLGQSGALAIHGVERAAQHYFGKRAEDLTLPEAALLAGLIPAPNRYSPLRHPERAVERRDRVLRAMAEQGRITEAQREEAAVAPLALRSRPSPSPPGAYFVSRVTHELEARLGEVALEEQGLSIFTTLDAGFQRAAESAVRRGLAELERRHPRLRRAEARPQAALVALDPQRGDVLAWVGGRDHARSPFDRAGRARRQPGSLMKPIVAASALSRRGNDHVLTLGTILADEPLEVAAEEGPWRPSNADGRHRGPVTLRRALEQSLNVPFARLGLEVGLVRVVETARRFGIESPLRPVPAVSLGTFEVTPLEITAAYTVFAAGGLRATPRTTLAVMRPNGRVRGGEKLELERVLEEAESYLVASALGGVVERGTARSLRKLGVSAPVAGKTGTSDGARDAWFVGFTPDLVVGVWVGFDDGARLGLSGAEAALPIFAAFAKGALARALPRALSVPKRIEVVAIDPETGLRAGRGCPGRDELFLPGTAPKKRCGRGPWAFFRRRD